jgi:hypothetical protein
VLVVDPADVPSEGVVTGLAIDLEVVEALDVQPAIISAAAAAELRTIHILRIEVSTLGGPRSLHST